MSTVCKVEKGQRRRPDYKGMGFAGGAITVRGSQKGKGTCVLGSKIGVRGPGTKVIWVGKGEKVLLERYHAMETGLGISQQVIESC